MAPPPSEEDIGPLDRWWRSANSLKVGQVYLQLKLLPRVLLTYEGPPTGEQRRKQQDGQHRDGRRSVSGRRSGLLALENGRTVAGQDRGEVGMSTTRMRSERLEVRTTKDERALIDRAVAEQGTDLTEFVIANLTVAARRVLADRTEFALDAESGAVWEAINGRRARDLPGLRRLMERPSPFSSE
jgi:uncharacterized protein (DUF1778 family)